MINIKRILALTAAITLALPLCACQKDEKKVKYEPVSNEDDTIYTIYMMQDEDSDYYNQVLTGYQDSINDLFGNVHLNIRYSKATPELSTDKIAEAYAITDPDLIFANGPRSVTSMAAAEQSTPIVGAGVINYQDEVYRIAAKKSALLDAVTMSENYTEPDVTSEWNGSTGTNLCGLTSMPDMERDLSLIIECTPVLYSVGIVMCENDNDAIYQAKSLEKMLEQAGLKYSEYFIPVSDDAREKYSIETEAATDMDTDDIVAEACAANSCLYIPSSDWIDDQSENICDIATDSMIPTVSSDRDVSPYALASIYEDPYMIGYSAGKLTYRILIKGANPADMQIESVDFGNEKLYNKKIADSLEREFPKSFYERNEFLKNYVPGSTTKRITSEELSQ